MYSIENMSGTYDSRAMVVLPASNRLHRPWHGEFHGQRTTNQNSTTNPHDTPQSNSKRVRYAVVGLGYIAQAAVLPAFKHAQENSELVALISDDDTKRAKLARFNDVSEMSCALMRFAGDRLAEFTCSFGAADRSGYEVVGTEGVLKMDPAYEMVGDLKRGLIRGGRSQKTKYKKEDQFGPELVYFSRCVLDNTDPEPGGKEGLADVRIIRALLESQDKNRPVRISPVGELRRPSEEQEIYKPPVEKPQLVKAAAPSKEG
jgi:hypothetical protein